MNSTEVEELSVDKRRKYDGKVKTEGTLVSFFIDHVAEN